MISFQQLKYFVTIIEAGSLNKASKVLYISQPALSKQITQLEQALHVTLLRRKPTGIELTEAGEFFYQKSLNILKQMDQLLEGVQIYSKAPPLRIGALPSIATYFLPNFLGKWNQNQRVTPSISVRDTTLELILMIENDEIDLAIVQDYESSKSLLTLELITEPYEALIPKAHMYSEKPTITFHEFASQQLVLHKRPCDIRHAIQKVCSDLEIELTNVIDLEFNESIITFVANGLGLSIAPRLVTENISNSNVLIKTLDPSPTRIIQAVYQSKNQKLINELFNK